LPLPCNQSASSAFCGEVCRGRPAALKLGRDSPTTCPRKPSPNPRRQTRRYLERLPRLHPQNVAYVSLFKSLLIINRTVFSNTRRFIHMPEITRCRSSPEPPTSMLHPCRRCVWANATTVFLMKPPYIASIAGRIIANRSQRCIADSKQPVSTRWFPSPTRGAPYRLCVLLIRTKSSSRTVPHVRNRFAFSALPKRIPPACSSTAKARLMAPSTKWSASSTQAV
jgi:hypothetical protein